MFVERNLGEEKSGWPSWRMLGTGWASRWRVKNIFHAVASVSRGRWRTRPSGSSVPYRTRKKFPSRSPFDSSLPPFYIFIVCKGNAVKTACNADPIRHINNSAHYFHLLSGSQAPRLSIPRAENASVATRQPIYSQPIGTESSFFDLSCIRKK